MNNSGNNQTNQNEEVQPVLQPIQSNNAPIPNVGISPTIEPVNNVQTLQIPGVNVVPPTNNVVPPTVTQAQPILNQVPPTNIVASAVATPVVGDQSPVMEQQKPIQSIPISMDDPNKVQPKSRLDLDFEKSNEKVMEVPETTVVKKGRWGYIIIILLLFCIIGGAFYFFGFNDQGIAIYKEFVGIEEGQEEKIEEVDLGKDNYLVKTLYNRLHYKLDNRSEALLYINTTTSVNQIDTSYLYNIILGEASREKLNNFNTYTINELNVARDTIFGTRSNISITAESIGDCPKYQFDSSSNSFISINNICENSSSVLVHNSIVSAKQYGETIYINEAVAFVDPITSKVYKSVDSNYNFSDEITDSTYETFDIEKESSKAGQYRYTFKYNSATDNYIFDSINRID